ncbi:MAG: dephospho-CoA kinase [Paludibacteraceae bacterium]|nr:dephospho-CoA kinase [Paludibacteraceae bacterium]
MQLIGITGGIGSGKSTICAQLRKMGYEVYDTDAEARRIMNTSPEIRSQMVAVFGEEAYVGDVLNRSYIAQIVFSDVSMLNRLNEITHPTVKADLKLWMSAHAEQVLCFVESALLYESELDSLCARTVFISAPVQIRVERAMMRDGVAEEKIRSRISRQMQDDVASRKSDYVLNNDGSESIEALTNRLLSFLHQQAVL